MDIVGEHRRAQARLVRSPEPLRLLHELAAAPLFRAYSWLGSAAPAVYLQVLLLSVGGLTGIAAGGYGKLVSGVALCHLGHVLTLAARRLDQAKGPDPWARMLDHAVGRAIEVALLCAIAWAAVAETSSPGFLPAPWPAASDAALVALAAGATGAVLLWHSLRAAEDLHLLRAHLLRSRRVPGPTLLARGSGGSAWLCLNRERFFLTVLAFTALGQPALLFGILLLSYGAGCMATLGRFRTRLADPEPRSSEILGRGYE